MRKKYLIHFLLRDKIDSYKHIHQSIETYADYFLNLQSALENVESTISKKDKENFDITIVGWQII